ncbi:MAG: hypothetical protein RL318_1729 [Fibrobacterota bacterium]|jgi:hypothetical protein
MRKGLEDYLQRLQAAADPWFLACPSERLTAEPIGQMRLLLLATLAQDQAPIPLGRLLVDLEDAFEGTLLDAGRQDWNEVVRRCAKVSRNNLWKHAEALPSILLSCADFLTRHPDLRAHLEASGPTDFVRDIAQDIPFTGRSSPWRDRPWRLTRWLVRGESGLAPIPAFLPHLRVPPAVLARTFRYLGIPVPKHEVPAKAWEWSNRICQSLLPPDPAGVWVPFMLLRRPRKRVWACQEHLGGCDECPLREPCAPPSRV